MDADRPDEHPAGNGRWEALVLLIMFAGTGFLTIILVFTVPLLSGSVPGTLDRDIAHALIFLPFASLVAGLFATWGRRRTGRPWLAEAVVIAVAGSLLTVLVLTVGLPSGAERATHERAQPVEADAELRAAVLARPDITVVEERFAQLRARLDAELPEAVPGARWPASTRDDPLDCDAGGNQRGVRIADHGTIDVIGADRAAIEAAVRRAAGPFGFDGPAEGHRDGIYLTGPDGSALWVSTERAGQPVRVGLESECHRPPAE